MDNTLVQAARKAVDALEDILDSDELQVSSPVGDEIRSIIDGLEKPLLVIEKVGTGIGTSVIWLKKVNTRDGKSVQRIEGTLIATNGDWSTVQTADGEKFSVPTTDLWAVK